MNFIRTFAAICLLAVTSPAIAQNKVIVTELLPEGQQRIGRTIVRYSFRPVFLNTTNIEIRSLDYTVTTRSNTMTVSGGAGKTGLLPVQRTVRGFERINVDINRAAPFDRNSLVFTFLDGLTALGFDNNQDGVRDDVQNALARIFPGRAPLRRVLEFGASGIQDAMTSFETNNIGTADAASEKLAAYSHCLVEVAGDDAEDAHATMLSLLLDSSARQSLYDGYSSMRVGTIQRSVNVDLNDCSI